MFDEPPFPLEAAFAARTQAALSAEPTTAWAAGLSISTCVGLLWAVDESFLGGESIYLESHGLPIEVSDAEKSICRGVMAAFEACRRGAFERPDADVGLSSEFLRVWSERRLDLWKHVQWGASLTRGSLPLLLSALNGCPSPALNPLIYCHKLIARIFTAQGILADIAGGAPLTFHEFFARLRQGMDRAGDVGVIASKFALKAQPRLRRVLGREWPSMAVVYILAHPPSQFRGMSFEAGLAQLRSNAARLLKLTAEELAAHAKESARRGSP